MIHIADKYVTILVTSANKQHKTKVYHAETHAYSVVCAHKCSQLVSWTESFTAGVQCTTKINNIKE